MECSVFEPRTIHHQWSAVECLDHSAVQTPLSRLTSFFPSWKSRKWFCKNCWPMSTRFWHRWAELQNNFWAPRCQAFQSIQLKSSTFDDVTFAFLFGTLNQILWCLLTSGLHFYRYRTIGSQLITDHVPLDTSMQVSTTWLLDYDISIFAYSTKIVQIYSHLVINKRSVTYWDVKSVLRNRPQTSP